MDYPYPSLILTDNKNPCITWDKAMKNEEFMKEYSNFTDNEKKIIDENINTRTCQTINNIKQCMTVEGKLETCGNLLEEDPKSISKEMGEIDKIAEIKKQKALGDLASYIERKEKTIDFLIEHKTTRETMLNMKQGYVDLAQSSIIKNKEKEIELSKKIDENENIRDFAEGDFKNTRINLEWYLKNNRRLVLVFKILLFILIIAIILFILSVRL